VIKSRVSFGLLKISRFPFLWNQSPQPALAPSTATSSKVINPVLSKRSSHEVNQFVAPYSPDLIPTISSANSDGVFSFSFIPKPMSPPSQPQPSVVSRVITQLASQAHQPLPTAQQSLSPKSSSSPQSPSTTGSNDAQSSVAKENVSKKTTRVGLHEAFLCAVEYLSSPDTILAK
jgi:hypothetical protein